MRKSSRVRNKQSGFSLAEILVALGILGIISAGAMSTMSFLFKSVGEVDRQADVRTLNGDLAIAITQKADCSVRLLSDNGSGFVLDKAAAAQTAPGEGQPIMIKLKEPGDTPVKSGTQPPTYKKLVVKSLKLRDIKQVLGTTNSWTASIYSEAAPVSAAVAKGGGLLSGYRERKVTQLFLAVNAAQSLVSCYSTGSDMETICNTQHGIFDSATQTCEVDPVYQCGKLGGQMVNGTCEMPSAAACANIGGTIVNGNCQMPKQTSCENIGGRIVNGSCQMPQQTSCENVGGQWINNNCQMPSDQTCNRLGGQWVNNNCQMPTDQTCAKLGGTMDNGKCALPASGEKTCQSINGDWVNGNCVTDSKNQCGTLGGQWAGDHCIFQTDVAANCVNSGGTWNDNMCFGRIDPNYSCSQLGGSMNNGKCDLSGTGPVTTIENCANPVITKVVIGYTTVFSKLGSEQVPIYGNVKSCAK